MRKDDYELFVDYRNNRRTMRRAMEEHYRLGRQLGYYEDNITREIWTMAASAQIKKTYETYEEE